MFRLLVVPIVVGILAFSIVYFAFPLLIAESDVVAVFAESVLDLSNSLFATMPRLVAGYLANLNLLAVALTIALLLTLTTQVLILLGDGFLFAAKWLVSICKRKPKQAGPADLPALEIDAGRLNSRPGNKILGGGFDSLDPD